jgi:hypothetical protein
LRSAKVFSKKNPFADGHCQWLSAQVFSKKNKNPPLCRQPLPGVLGIGFSKKNKNPLFADGPATRPSAKKFSKNRQTNPLLMATFFGRRALSSGARQRAVTENKILREACAERDRRQSRCRRFIGLCREFSALGKGWISSSDVNISIT